MKRILKRLLGPIYRRIRRLAQVASPTRAAATGRFLADLWVSQRSRRREPLLTVAVDISSFWEPLTGIGWYLYRLLEHLADRDDLRLRLYGPALIAGDEYPQPVVELPQGPAIDWITYRVPEGLTIPRGIVERVLQKTRPLSVAADGNEVVFAPNYLVPGTFRLCRGKRVVTVHDLGYLKVPETLQSETLEDLSRGMARTFSEAKEVITPSQAVAREIVEAGLVPEPRVTAIHHGPGQLAGIAAGELPEGLPQPYVLFVGTVEPRKNLSTALTAWRLLGEQRRQPPPLVICGRLGWQSDQIRKELEQATQEGWLLHLGYVDNPTLKALYQRALAVVFPSLYEGFGLPAVEAQQSGAPLICSDLPVFREVAGAGALYAPADAPAAWCSALCRLLDEPDLRSELSRAGRESAASFSWETAAASTEEVWRKAAGRTV